MYTKAVIQKILRDVRTGKISAKQAYKKLKNLPYEAFSFARVDHHRFMRKGMPEAVYSPGKNFGQLVKIVRSMRRAKTGLLLTRLDERIYRRLKRLFPYLKYSKHGRIAYITGHESRVTSHGLVAVITAGTADVPVAEEAAITLEVLGHMVERVYDCGVAGLHRLLDNLGSLHRARAIICVAGMEGALASVVAGLVDQPVIAVPTSVGYGASFKGIAPLLAMLNTCSQGVAVVNIDNGFGAACFASLVAS